VVFALTAGLTGAISQTQLIVTVGFAGIAAGSIAMGLEGYLVACGDADPKLPQVAFFGTTFHRDLPRGAGRLPIPRHFDAQGMQRHGFHDLSYAYPTG